MILLSVSTLGLALLSTEFRVASADDKVRLRRGSDADPLLGHLDQDKPRTLSSPNDQCVLTLHKDPLLLRTWNEANEFCKLQGGAGSRLATLGEHCPLGRNRDPIFGKKSGDEWVPYHDDKNGWVNIGTWGGPKKETCITHLEATLVYPEWGVDASTKQSYQSNFVYCYECPGTCSYNLHTSPSGVNNWNQAKEYCESQGAAGSRLVTFDEICPLGVDSSPASGVQAGDQWMAMDDYKNGWVQIGRWPGNDQTCVTHMEAIGQNPDWGEDNSRNSYESNSLHCFECSDTVKHSDTCPPGYEDNGATTTCIRSSSVECNEECARLQCASSGGFWADLNPSLNPNYGCHMLGTFCPTSDWYVSSKQYGKTCTKSVQIAAAEENCPKECVMNLCHSRGGIFPPLDFRHNPYTCFAPYDPETKKMVQMFPENTTMTMRLAEMTYDSVRLSVTSFDRTNIEYGLNEDVRHREGYDSFEVWNRWDLGSKVDQSIVAKSRGVCYGAFSGTTKSISDWFQNLNTDNVEIHAHGKKCWARKGFYEGYVNEYRTKFDAKLNSCLQTCGDSDCPLVLTGGSQGGAIAVVAAAYWKHKNPIVITFGAPRAVQTCELLDDKRHYRWATTAPIPLHHMGYDIVVNSPGFGAIHHGHAFLLADNHTYNDQPTMLEYNNDWNLWPDDLGIHSKSGYLRQGASLHLNALVIGPLNATGWKTGAPCREQYHCASRNCHNWYCA